MLKLLGTKICSWCREEKHIQLSYQNLKEKRQLFKIRVFETSSLFCQEPILCLIYLSLPNLVHTSSPSIFSPFFNNNSLKIIMLNYIVKGLAPLWVVGDQCIPREEWSDNPWFHTSTREELSRHLSILLSILESPRPLFDQVDWWPTSKLSKITLQQQISNILSFTTRNIFPIHHTITRNNNIKIYPNQPAPPIGFSYLQQYVNHTQQTKYIQSDSQQQNNESCEWND